MKKSAADFSKVWLERLGEPQEVRNQVMRLIQVTDHRTELCNELEELIVDIDLSIMGREPSVYDAYARNIRLEYQTVPETAYRQGRARILRQFLDRDSLYRTSFFRKKYEHLARSNLAREIATLTV